MEQGLDKLVLEGGSDSFRAGSKIKGIRPIPLTLVSGLLRLFDFLVILLSGYFVYLFYENFREIDSDFHYFGPSLTGALVASAVFQFAGVYEQAELARNGRQISKLLIGWLMTLGILLTIAFASKITANYSRLWTGGWALTAFFGLAAGRLIIGQVMAKMAAEGRFARRAVIVGAGELGEKVGRHIENYGGPYLRLIGYVDDRVQRTPSNVAGHKVLGNVNELMKYIELNDVDVVIIALPWSAERRLMTLIGLLATKPVQIRLAPDLIGFNFLDRATTVDARLPMLHLFDRPLSGWSYVLKRAEDWIIALLVMLFLGPLMLLIAIAIKLDSPGPILFRQKRFGFNNQPFYVLKFRTMHVDAQAQDGSRQASKNDPRITRIGRFLRSSSLDELPQVLNVLRGDMSVVGPRPHPLEMQSKGRRLDTVVERYAARHRVKPGITGWAQVNGWRGETDTMEKIEQRIEHDLYYIDNWSVWFDLRIILKTLWVVWQDQNAY